MLVYCLVLLLVIKVESAVQNVSCPVVPPRELDWKELDGFWYIQAVATELQIRGDCATVMFSHKSITTDVSISCVTNNTVSYYNGSVAIAVDSSGLGDLLLVTYTDKRVETYSLLDVNYEHYAVIFACYNNSDGNSSTYEIWKLTRSPHLKATDRIKLDQAVANYSLQATEFFRFNNTEDSCRINGGTHINPASLIMASAAALSLFRRFF
ncbi:uncharacterized protein [Epargyreus clarus]|uniref:uncharacterized protein n=1 Tax=Epargyreus clarus TaxID=520877 RepID=UPI003C2B3443